MGNKDIFAMNSMRRLFTMGRGFGLVGGSAM